MLYFLVLKGKVRTDTCKQCNQSKVKNMAWLLKKLTPTSIDRKLTQVLRGSSYCRNPQRIFLIGRVVFPMSTPDKEITFFPILMGEGRSEMIGQAMVCFEIYKKPSKASFMLKKSSSRAILGTARPLSLKKTRRPTKTL